MYFGQNECRRFRVKFQGRDSEGVVSCKDAVNKLRKHFPIKTMGHGADGEQEVGKCSNMVPSCL